VFSTSARGAPGKRVNEQSQHGREPPGIAPHRIGAMILPLMVSADLVMAAAARTGVLAALQIVTGVSSDLHR